MNYHVIFNALILLFILHIFLSNIDYHQIIGIPKKIENFGRQLGVPDNKEEEQKKMEYEQSLRFLQDSNSSPAQNDEDFKKKLLSFINKKETPVGPSETAMKSFEDRNVYPILPSNSFTSNVNVPNFESNVLDVQKFYKRNIEFDNLSENQLESSIKENFDSQKDSYTNERTSSDVVMKSTPIPNLSNDTNDSRSPFGRISTEQPPVWTYKNEMPMNGGSMGGGIVGYDSLESQFSLYSSGVMNMQPANSANFQVIPHDDLRKPIKYED